MEDVSPESVGRRLCLQCSAGVGGALRDRAEQKVLGHGKTIMVGHSRPSRLPLQSTGSWLGNAPPCVPEVVQLAMD